MTSFRATLWLTASSVFVIYLCVISMTHAAFIIDGNGMRQVNVTKLLEAARLRSPALARRSPTCRREDMLVRLGSTWSERCRECSCTESGTQCTGGPTCSLPYHAHQEYTCGKFNADGCCCDFEGCLLDDGTQIPLGGDMPTDPARPCYKCKCKGGKRTTCLVETCFPFMCTDSVQVPGQCCPDCPNGRTCFLPTATRNQIEAMGLIVEEPLREGTPVTVLSGTALEAVCTCSGNLIATCKQTAKTSSPFFGPSRFFDRFNIVA